MTQSKRRFNTDENIADAAGKALLAACVEAKRHLVETGNPFAGGDCDLGQQLSRAIKLGEQAGWKPDGDPKNA